MADNLQSGMAQPKLYPGMKVVLEAVDPITGAAVAGVTISQVVISGDPIDEPDLSSSGPFMFVPGPGDPGALTPAGTGTVTGGL